MTLTEMKKSSASYKDIPNGEFAYRVWNSEKEDDSKETLPMGMWADEHGVSNEDFKAMIEFSKSSGYDPTDRTISNEHIPEDSAARATFQGQTFGFGDEIVGGLAAVTDMAMRNFESLEDYTYGDGEKTFDELYTHYRDQERQHMKDFRTNASGEALTYEIGGALISPAMLAKIPSAVKSMTAGKQAMTVSGAYGGAYGAGASEEESATGIAKDAAISTMTSALFGLGVQKAVPLAGEAGKKFAEMLKRNEKMPTTVEGLRVVKNKAYELVNKSKAKFNIEDLKWLQTEAHKIATKNHHQEFKDASTQGALNMIDKLISKGDDLTLMQLDKIRQQLGVRFKSKPEQIALKEMMDAVDTLILNKSSKFPEMSAARLANIKYKKAEKIDHYFEKAKTDLDLKKVGATQLYKAAIASLLKNKKDVRWFSEEEVKIMSQFVKGGKAQNAVARLGTISPGSSKLMAALGLYGFYVSPMILIPTALSMFAKKFADKGIKTKAEQLIKTVGGVETPPVPVVPGMKPVGAISEIYQQ